MFEVDINSIQPNPFNTNHVSPENELKLENSIRRFGVYKPVICRELPSGTIEIIGGEHRWRSAKKLGHTTVPIVNLGLVPDAKAKEIMLVDNGRYGEDDTLALAELLKELGNAEEILGFLPYSDDELDSIFASSSIALDDLDDEGDLPDLNALPAKKVQSHQVMRFKIPVEDAEFIQKVIDSVMKSQGFTEEDSMANAGNALVHIFRAQK